MTDKKEKEVQYCSITEQGDLGLGASVLAEADQKVLQEAAKKEENNK